MYYWSVEHCYWSVSWLSWFNCNTVLLWFYGSVVLTATCSCLGLLQVFLRLKQCRFCHILLSHLYCFAASSLLHFLKLQFSVDASVVLLLSHTPFVFFTRVVASLVPLLHMNIFVTPFLLFCCFSCNLLFQMRSTFASVILLVALHAYICRKTLLLHLYSFVFVFLFIDVLNEAASFIFLCFRCTVLSLLLFLVIVVCWGWSWLVLLYCVGALSVMCSCFSYIFEQIQL